MEDYLDPSPYRPPLVAEARPVGGSAATFPDPAAENPGAVTLMHVERPNTERPQGPTPVRPIAWEYAAVAPRTDRWRTLDEARDDVSIIRVPLLHDPGGSRDMDATSPVPVGKRIYMPEHMPWDTGLYAQGPV